MLSLTCNHLWVKSQVPVWVVIGVGSGGPLRLLVLIAEIRPVCRLMQYTANHNIAHLSRQF